MSKAGHASKKMPVARDVRIHQMDAKDAAESEALTASVAAPGLVTVIGFDKGDVLFRSDKANVIQIRDAAGKISTLFVRVRRNLWGMVRRGDDDWDECLAMYGSSDNPPKN